MCMRECSQSRENITEAKATYQTVVFPILRAVEESK